MHGVKVGSNYLGMKIFILLIALLTIFYQQLSACKLEKPPKDRNPLETNGTINNQKHLNILILTFSAPGHTAIPLALGEELVRRGHDVTFSTVGNKSQKAAEKLGIRYKNAGNSDIPDVIDVIRKNLSTILHQPSVVGQFKAMLTVMPEIYKMFVQQGELVTDFVKSEGEAGMEYDMVIATDFFMMLLPCVSSYIGAPAILISTSSQVYPHTYPPWAWPSTILGISEENLSFLQRLANQLERMFFPSFLNLMLRSPISTSVDTICPRLSLAELQTAPAVYIPNIVPTVIGFEYSRTMTPMTHYVGPIMSKNKPDLSNDLERWLDGKPDNSVIYISMGSITSITEDIAHAIVNGIKKTNFSVVWAIRKEGDFELRVDPENYYVSNWLPQVSVLQHRAVSLSILHCGANGIHESLYYGIPAICMPGTSEQRGNAARVSNHKLGLTVNKEGLTEDLVYNSIKELESRGYKENVLKLGRMFRAAGGAGRAAELVEYYSEVGYAHLVPAYAKYNWSWVQFYNVDVYLFMLASLIITSYLWYKTIRCFCTMCCCRAKKVKSD